ncbi:protein of unknown function [Dyella sp. OK004]|uniref:DUF4328 domain-containing protein n=1 Tax=Dyella sp. OK004 TaxID=1855292 RepID=UPI0008EE5A4C|nr:DUF4328 domain-containing protein [Dyella sp. OK004]SFS06679.1 protein of unknown function [Dyella sp. OK004]
MEYTYRSLDSRTTWLCRLLYMLAAMDVVSLFGNHYQRTVLRRVAYMTADNAEAIQAQAASSDFWTRLIAIPPVGLLLVVYVLAGMWIHRAAANTRALGASGLSFTPGWAVGWHFIPFANLVKPYQAMSEIWRASADPYDWDRTTAPRELPLWWGLWLATCFIGNAMLRLSLHAEKVDELLTVNTLSIASDLVSLPLNLLFAHILIRIADMQASQPDPAEAPGLAATA